MKSAKETSQKTARNISLLGLGFQFPYLDGMSLTICAGKLPSNHLWTSIGDEWNHDTVMALKTCRFLKRMD